jgi:hypothetical protein
MTTRIAFIVVKTLIMSASSANAQGRPPQRVVLSQDVMKAMVANKPKSKASLTARLGMVRRSNVAATAPERAAATSVREIDLANKKR